MVPGPVSVMLGQGEADASFREMHIVNNYCFKRYVLVLMVLQLGSVQ